MQDTEPKPLHLTCVKCKRPKDIEGSHCKSLNCPWCRECAGVLPNH